MDVTIVKYVTYDPPQVSHGLLVNKRVIVIVLLITRYNLVGWKAAKSNSKAFGDSFAVRPEAKPKALDHTEWKCS
jgi:hypothetical protein